MERFYSVLFEVKQTFSPSPSFHSHPRINRAEGKQVFSQGHWLSCQYPLFSCENEVVWHKTLSYLKNSFLWAMISLNLVIFLWISGNFSLSSFSLTFSSSTSFIGSWSWAADLTWIFPRLLVSRVLSVEEDMGIFVTGDQTQQEDECKHICPDSHNWGKERTTLDCREQWALVCCTMHSGELCISVFVMPLIALISDGSACS